MKWYLMVLSKYATFKGRSRRKEYWMFTLFSTLISIVISLSAVMRWGIPELVYLGNIYSLAVLIPSLAVGVRRMHDVGKSGWYLLIPIYNLILAVREGDHAANEYGEDPKNEEPLDTGALDSNMLQ